MEKVVLPLSTLAEIFGQPVESLTSNFKVIDETTKEEKVLSDEEIAKKVADLFKGEKDRFFTEGKKTGTRERMTAFEKSVREKYGVQANTEGEALIDLIVGEHKTKAERLAEELEAAKKTQKKDMTNEEQKAFIVNHPFFSEKLADAKKEAEKLAAEFEQYKSAEETKKVVSDVERGALAALEQYKPVESEDTEIAGSIRKAYISAILNGAGSFKRENDTLLVFDKNGDKIKDSNYRELTFEQYAQAIAAKFYKAHPADPSKKTPEGGGDTGKSGVLIPDWSKMAKEDIYNTVLNEQDPAKRKELTDSAAAFLS